MTKIIKNKMNKIQMLIMMIATMVMCVGCQYTRMSLEEVAADTDAKIVIDEAEKEIINGTNDFSFEMVKSFMAANKGKDFVISPLSVVYSLEIINNGANGNTKQLLQKHLGASKYEQNDVNSLWHKLMIRHAKVYENKKAGWKSAFLKSSNLLLYRDEHNINHNFIKTIGDDYFADCLPFVQQNDAQQIVDEWNKEMNHGIIKRIPLDFDESTNVCLINTMLFKAAWSHEFEETEIDTFYVKNNDFRMVNMMWQRETEGHYKYMQNEQYSMLRMPYIGAFYMDVILPHKGIPIDSLMRKIDLNAYKKSTQMLKKYDEIEVKFPKFHIQSEINLETLLSNMGLFELFSEKANLSLMSNEPLYINKMRQKNDMNVDEKGTSAQAVTVTDIVLCEIATRDPERAEFFANRPFFFFICDSFGTICFAGTYNGFAE